MLSKSFAPMSSEAARIKYPSQPHPQTFMTVSSDSVNLLFQRIIRTVAIEGIEDYWNQAEEFLKGNIGCFHAARKADTKKKTIRQRGAPRGQKRRREQQNFAFAVWMKSIYHGEICKCEETLSLFPS